MLGVSADRRRRSSPVKIVGSMDTILFLIAVNIHILRDPCGVTWQCRTFLAFSTV